MICDKCGFDMPASCCVIGNYWDCSSCKAQPKITMLVHDEIQVQIPDPTYAGSITLAEVVKRETEGILEQMATRMEKQLFLDSDEACYVVEGLSTWQATGDPLIDKWEKELQVDEDA